MEVSLGLKIEQQHADGRCTARAFYRLVDLRRRAQLDQGEYFEIPQEQVLASRSVGFNAQLPKNHLQLRRFGFAIVAGSLLGLLAIAGHYLVEKRRRK